MKDPLYEVNCMHGFIFGGLQAPVDWEDVDVTPVKGPDGNFRLPPKIFESMDRTKVGLKGPLATPIGKGHQSLNLALRKLVLSQSFSLFSNIFKLHLFIMYFINLSYIYCLCTL